MPSIPETRELPFHSFIPPLQLMKFIWTTSSSSVWAKDKNSLSNRIQEWVWMWTETGKKKTQTLSRSFSVCNLIIVLVLAGGGDGRTYLHSAHPPTIHLTFQWWSLLTLYPLRSWTNLPLIFFFHSRLHDPTQKIHVWNQHFDLIKHEIK